MGGDRGQSSRIGIPEDVVKATADVGESESPDPLQQTCIVFMAGPQAVVGNGVTQVMHGMATNVGGEPVQQAWQVQVTGAFEHTGHRAPSVAAVGVGISKIVLDEEHADEQCRPAGH